MKKKIVLRLVQLLFGVLIVYFSINLTKSFCDVYKIKKLSNIENYTESYLEVSDIIKKQNRYFQSRIYSFEDLHQCLALADNDLSKMIFDENHTILVINPDSIIIKYRFDESFTNMIARKILGVRTNYTTCKENIFELAAFSNIIDRKDTIIFSIEKKKDTNENIFDTIRGIVKQEVKLFLNKNPDYYLYGNWLYVTFEYSPELHKYTYEVSNEIDYAQELLMVNIRASLHDFMLSQCIKKATVRIQTPTYSPIPPP